MNRSELSIIPYPRGKDFAISFVDDTDFSTRTNIEPVYSKLASLGIMGTKTVWIFDQKRSSSFRRDLEKTLPLSIRRVSGESLENADYLDFILHIKRMGFEIALHNVAAGNSIRGEIINGLKRFKTIFGNYPRINALHQTNIENLYAGKDKIDVGLFRILEWLKDRSQYQGHIEQSPNYWGDIARNKIKYFRLPFHTIQSPNTLKVNPSMPFHDKLRPYVNYWFASSDGSNCSRFVRLINPANIEKLTKEKGICLIYTHLAKGFIEIKNGKIYFNPEFEKNIELLSQNKRAWFPTASILLDRLLALKQISINWDQFDLKISNKGKETIEDLTLLCSSGLSLTDDKGRTFYSSADNKIILPIVPAKSYVVFKTNFPGSFVLKMKGKNIPVKERKRIEWLNYYGLLKQKVLNL